MKKLVVVLLSIIVVASTTMPALAVEDAPKGFGVGVETGQEYGVMPYYTLSSMFQLGLAIGLKLQSNANVFLLGPQARFMFPLGVAAMKLFLDAQFRIAFQPQNDYIGFRTRLGLMSMVAATVALYGGISFLDFQFEPTEITCIGLLSPFLGVQWTPEM
jgi:hypothetical protein